MPQILILTMDAFIRLQLSDALSPQELRELTALAAEQQKPVERILLEAAREAAAKARAHQEQPQPTAA